jgi:hypothetical protein
VMRLRGTDVGEDHNICIHCNHGMNTAKHAECVAKHEKGE